MDQPLADIQNGQPPVPLAINRVGVRGLRRPLRLRDRSQGTQTTIARIDLGVALSALWRGTHMSRLLENLEAWDETLGCQATHRLLDGLRQRLHAESAWVKFVFPYLIRKNAPATGSLALTAYDCAVSATCDDNGLLFVVSIRVPVMTVCPCSLAISAIGAHSQRATAHIQARISHFVWLEDFIEIAENSGSAPVFPLLKRKDEKYVTELAFSNPAFVEDVARRVASSLARHEHVLAFKVDVESMESIHNHNAFAVIESDNWRSLPE